ncbi:MAG: CRISPR-associated protein Csx3 [Elusimicrobiota bacterium]
MIIIKIDDLYKDKAKLNEIDIYIDKILKQAGDGNEVTLTGPAPIWLYLKAAHVLHGKAKKLIYKSPVAGEIIIFDHDPY